MKKTRICASVFLFTCLTFVSAGFVFAKTASDVNVPDEVSAIIDGSAASISTYPWMAFLADEFGEQFCGASLISETWVLTAAHCFLNAEGDAVDIEAGANSIVVLNSDTAFPFAEEAIEGAIGQIIVHPDYNPNAETSDNRDNFDIAVVELTAAVDITPVVLLSGNAPALYAGMEAIIMGWGTTAIDAEGASIEPSNDLLQATQAIVDAEECSAIYGGGITEFMLCAGSVEQGGTTDTCQGDSGGPMVMNSIIGFVQVGVVSFGGTEFGPSCGDPDAPGVYSNVATLAGFIEQHATDAQFIDPDFAGEAASSGNNDTTAEPSIDLAIEVAGNDVLIFWSSLASATGYTLYYAPAPAGEPISAIDMGPQLTISGELPAGTSFFVAIEPYNAQGPLPILSNIANLIVPAVD